MGIKRKPLSISVKLNIISKVDGTPNAPRTKTAEELGIPVTTLCAGVSSPCTLLACATTYSPPLPLLPFRLVHFCSNSSLCVQPACGLHQNSVSAGRQNSVRMRLAGGCSPSPAGVVPWMELWFRFSPTPPGRYPGFVGFSTWHVQHLVFIIVSIVSFLVCYFHFCNFIYIKFVMLIYILYFRLCRCTAQDGLSEAGAVSW
jgi:hypothetical protein